MKQFTINGTYQDNQLVKVEDIQVELANGVYILHTNGTLYTKDEWDTSWNNESAGVGVVVKTDKCQFVIAPDEANSIVQQDPYNIKVEGILTAHNMDEAKLDFAGLANTQAAIEQLQPTIQSAFTYCHEYVFRNGKTGYLPALGEWVEAYNHHSDINACMNLIGGTPMYYQATGNMYKWSSTDRSKMNAWYIGWNIGSVGTAAKKYNTKYYCARPFTTL